jgi:hypothetical protein
VRRARHLRAPATPAEALRGGCAAMASRRNATGTSVRLVAEPEQAARRLWVAEANSDTAILFHAAAESRHSSAGPNGNARPAAPPVASQGKAGGARWGGRAVPKLVWRSIR